jgi:flagellar motor switch protein FliM
LGGLIVQALWNWLTPSLFGWREVTFWQAVGLLALCRILFGGLGRHGMSHRMRSRMSERMAERGAERIADRMSEHWEAMTPEQRERFRQRMRERFGGASWPD